MKSIISTAKNFSLLLVAALLFFAGCDNKNNPNPQNLYGNAARPTWQAVDDPDLTTSMTAVIRVNTLCDQAINDTVVGEKDVLAAFAGETCIGVAEYVDGLFFLFITSTDGNVSLRYYSAHYTNLFEQKDAFPFVNQTQQGNPETPYIPKFGRVE